MARRPVVIAVSVLLVVAGAGLLLVSLGNDQLGWLYAAIGACIAGLVALALAVIRYERRA